MLSPPTTIKLYKKNAQISQISGCGWPNCFLERYLFLHHQPLLAHVFFHSFCVSEQLRSIWSTTSSPRHKSHVGIYLSILPSEEACRTHTDELLQPGSCSRRWYSFSWSGSSLPLLNPNVHYRVHEHKPMDPYHEPDVYSPHTHTLPIYIFMTHYSVMLPTNPVSPILSLPFVSLLLLWFENTAYLLHSTIFPYVLHIRPILSTQ